MATVRHISWYIQSFLKKHGKVLLISTVIGVLMFILLPNILATLPVVKQTTYIGRVGRFPLSQLPRDIQEKVSFGLMKSLPDGEVVPALASSYRIEENGKAYRFTLRGNVAWQDGMIVNPSDITYTFTDTEIARSQNDILFRLVAKKQEETALEPVLPVSFLTTLSQPLFRQVKARTWFFQRPSYKIIGLGIYEITSVKNQGPAIAELTLESPQERLVYRFYPTEADAILAFKKGDVDRLEEMLTIGDLAAWNNVTIDRSPRSDQYLGIFFNMSAREGESALFSNKNIRQALNYATPKKEGMARVLSPISRASWAYVANENDLEKFEQNPQEAADLLAKAESPSPMTIDLTTTPTYAEQAESIAQEWRDVGVLAAERCKATKDANQDQCENKRLQVSVKITNFPDLSNYQAMLMGQQVPRDPDQYPLWHSTQPTNFTHIKNARIDKLLEDGRRTINKEERKLLYQEFQTLLVKESPVVFLEPLVNYTVTRKSLW